VTAYTGPYAHVTDACQGCGNVDPCGEHFADCTLLEPGDVLFDRVSGRFVGIYDGPCRACELNVCLGTHLEEDE
jgi:hypothetical protein